MSIDPPPPPRRKSNDNSPVARGAVLVDDLVMGLRFFSRLPLGDRPHQRPDLNRIALALAFTSLAIGIGPALLLTGASWLGLPSFFAAALAVAALVIVTGAMAEDGLADAADGLFGGGSAERRLEILRDSRHGTYGVCALCLLLLLRVAGLGAVAAFNPLAAGGLWLAAMVLSRSAALWLTVALPPARADGAAAGAGRVTRQNFAVGAVFAVILGFVLAAPFAGILGFALALLLAAGVVFGWTQLCSRLVGGQTGDLIGALQALLEIAALTAFLLFA